MRLVVCFDLRVDMYVDVGISMCIDMCIDAWCAGSRLPVYGHVYPGDYVSR